MKRVVIPILFLFLVAFSSCLFRRDSSDAHTDKALGLDADTETLEAQQELEALRKEQIREQQHQLERQITDPLNPASSN